MCDVHVAEEGLVVGGCCAGWGGNGGGGGGAGWVGVGEGEAGGVDDLVGGRKGWDEDGLDWFFCQLCEDVKACLDGIHSRSGSVQELLPKKEK